MPLLICATPIGNLEDVTLRVLEALRRADAVLCEDTRRTKILLDRYGIRAEGLIAVHRHNERRQAQELVVEGERAVELGAGDRDVIESGRAHQLTCPPITGRIAPLT